MIFCIFLGSSTFSFFSGKLKVKEEVVKQSNILDLNAHLSPLTFATKAQGSGLARPKNVQIDHDASLTMSLTTTILRAERMALGQKENPWGPQVLVYFTFYQ